MTEYFEIQEPVTKDDLPKHPGLLGRVMEPPGVDVFGNAYPARMYAEPVELDSVYFSRYLSKVNHIIPAHSAYKPKPRPNQTTSEVVASISALYEEAMDYKTKGFFCYGFTNLKADQAPVARRIGEGSFVFDSVSDVREKYKRVPLDRNKQPWVLATIEGQQFYYPAAFGNDFVRVIVKIMNEKRTTGAYSANTRYSTREIAGGEWLQKYVDTIEAKRRALEEAEPAVRVNLLNGFYRDFFTGNNYNDHNGASVIMWKGEALRAIYEGAATTGDVVKMWATKGSPRFWVDLKPGIKPDPVSKGWPFYCKPEQVEAIRAAGVGITDEEHNSPALDNDAVLSLVFDAYTPEPNPVAVEQYKAQYLESNEV